MTPQDLEAAKRLALAIRSARLHRHDLMPRNTGADKEPSREIDVDTIGWTTRVRNALRDEGIATLGQVAERSRAEWRRVPNIGDHSIREIEARLTEAGLTFGDRRISHDQSPQFQCPHCGGHLTVRSR